MVDSRVLAGKVPLDQILPRGACHPGIAISDAADVEVIPCLRRSVVVGGREESEVEVVAMSLVIIRGQNARKGPIKTPRRPSISDAAYSNMAAVIQCITAVFGSCNTVYLQTVMKLGTSVVKLDAVTAL